jgi:hypothetical protein
MARQGRENIAYAVGLVNLAVTPLLSEGHRNQPAVKMAMSSLGRGEVSCDGRGEARAHAALQQLQRIAVGVRTEQLTRWVVAVVAGRPPFLCLCSKPARSYDWRTGRRPRESHRPQGGRDDAREF